MPASLTPARARLGDFSPGITSRCFVTVEWNVVVPEPKPSSITTKVRAAGYHSDPAPMLAPLPIDSSIPQMITNLRGSGALVLVAPPGAGKTTRVPPAILRAGLLSKDHPNLV